MDGEKAIELLYEYIRKGFSPREAVQQLYIEELIERKNRKGF